MEQTEWVMESECCSRCGCLLDYFETELCTDCLHDAWYFEEQNRYEVWDDEDVVIPQAFYDAFNKEK